MKLNQCLFITLICFMDNQLEELRIHQVQKQKTFKKIRKTMKTRSMCEANTLIISN